MGESKLGVVSLYWGRLLGGGGEVDRAPLSPTPIKTSYKKFGYVKDFSYIYILLTLGKDNFFKKQICLSKIFFVYLIK